MEEKKTSVLSNGLIWFGAAVSIAEILTGTLLAPLGFAKGLAAIIIGHLIGCILLYFAGVIGAETERSSMETVKMSFGQKGSFLFSFLNVLQLVGWTAVMIFNGAIAAQTAFSISNEWIWSVIIGPLIIVWIMIGIKNLGKVNVVAMTGLFILTIVLSVVVFKGNVAKTVSGDGISFGAAVELAVAMPLSWLPLISDYTRTAEKKKKTTFVSAIVYFFASCYMYVIGMGAAIFTGESDVAKIMVSAGLGIVALVIIIFSTVTTTFLDAYSAGVSSVSISKKIDEKKAAIIVTVIGTALAIFTPITKFEDFLYLIGSVFAPMIAIQITDYFVIKKSYIEKQFNIKNLIIWAAGFALYRCLMKVDILVGNTLPDMAVVIIVCIIINKIFGGEKDVLRKIGKCKK